MIKQLVLAIVIITGCTNTMFTEEMSDHSLEKRIAELIEALTVHKSDVTDKMTISEGKKKEMEKVSEELKNIGYPAVPALIKETRLTYSSKFNESETGWAAARILINIGEPALPYLESSKFAKGDIIQNIIKQIKNGLES